MKNTTRIRKQLHNYINQADDRMIRIMQAIAEADTTSSALSEAENTELDKRKKQHIKGLSESFTPRQIRERLENRS